MKICKIKRIIIEECGNTHNCVTILTIGGRIVKQDWENIDYVLYINPLLEITDKKPHAYEKIPLIKRWEDDMQIFSQYLDTKVTIKRFSNFILIFLFTEHICNANKLLFKRSSRIKKSFC